MKTYFYSILLILGFSAIIFGLNSANKVTHLLPYQGKEISLDTNFDINEFSEIDSAIAKANVVLIGEQTHYDEEPTIIRHKLINYLNSQHHFDVVLFESSLFDINFMNTHLEEKHEKNILFEKGLFNFYVNHKSGLNLLKYITQPNKNIAINAFDMQYAGNLTQDERLVYLLDYLKNDLKIDSLKTTFIATNLPFHLRVYKPRMAKSNSISLEKLLDEIAQKAFKRNTNNDSLWGLIITNIRTEILFSQKFIISSVERFSYRDSVMANNILFLKYHLYPNRKIIILASNLHTAYRANFPKNFKPMGQHLKEVLKSDCYSIAITSYAYQKQHNIYNSFYNNGTIEQQLYYDGYKCALFPFNTYLAESTMEINQHLALKSNWNKTYDSFIFIDKITPSNQYKND